MHIGSLARATGTTTDALRHYERLGLIRPGRDANGYRRYRPDDIHAVHLIRRAQRLGFTLAEIRDVLPRFASGRLHCAVVAARLDAKLADVDRQMAALSALRHDIADLRASVTTDGDVPVRFAPDPPRR